MNVFSTKVPIEDTIFTSVSRDETAILRGEISNAKVQLFAGQRRYFHFSIILSIVPAPGIKPTTSRSVVERSID